MGKQLENLMDVLPLIDSILADMEYAHEFGNPVYDSAITKLERLRALIDDKLYEADYVLDDDEVELEELDFSKVDYSKIPYPSDE